MTIEFNCPHCGALIAFDSKHAGRGAKCLTCGQRFLIPAASFQKAEKVTPEPEVKEEPVPGFYRAAFLDNWRVFFRRESVTPLVFVTALVCFRFFLAGSCCLSYVASVVTCGWLFGYYLTVIHHTVDDEDALPEVDIGTSITILWHALAPILVFVYTLFLVELPFVITLAIASNHGITASRVWSGHTPLHLLLQIFQVGGLFVFPAAILTLAAGQDFTLLRPDYLLAPLFRAFFPYLTVVLLLLATCFLEMHTTQYTGHDPMATARHLTVSTTLTARHLAVNLLVQVLALVSMRSIGLLYRHYGCYFKW
jgi:DNA-directed RNA polymerase subunit RPC12/RpoP